MLVERPGPGTARGEELGHRGEGEGEQGEEEVDHLLAGLGVHDPLRLGVHQQLHGECENGGGRCSRSRCHRARHAIEERQRCEQFGGGNESARQHGPEILTILVCLGVEGTCLHRWRMVCMPATVHAAGHARFGSPHGVMCGRGRGRLGLGPPVQIPAWALEAQKPRADEDDDHGPWASAQSSTGNLSVCLLQCGSRNSDIQTI